MFVITLRNIRLNNSVRKSFYPFRAIITDTNYTAVLSFGGWVARGEEGKAQGIGVVGSEAELEVGSEAELEGEEGE